MVTVVPRYFRENKQLINFEPHRAFGVEFRVNTDICRYALTATSHMVVFILKGEKIIHQEQGDIHLRSGSLVFIPKGTYLFSDIRAEDALFQRLILFLEESFIEEFLYSLNDTDCSTISDDSLCSLPISELLAHSINSIQPYLSKELNYGESLLEMKCRELLLTILESDSENRFLSALKKAVTTQKDLHRVMTENFFRPLTVSEFAQLASRSSRQFSRDFKNLFGMTPRDWLTKKRLELAHSLIHTTDKSISEICYDSGFRNYSNFIQLFRKQYSITPKQMQKQIKFVS